MTAKASPRHTFAGQTWDELANHLNTLGEAAGKSPHARDDSFWPNEQRAAAKARANTFAVCANIVREFAQRP